MLTYYIPNANNIAIKDKNKNFSRAKFSLPQMKLFFVHSTIRIKLIQQYLIVG